MLFIGTYWSLLQGAVTFFLRSDVPGYGKFNTLIPSIQYAGTFFFPACLSLYFFLGAKKK